MTTTSRHATTSTRRSAPPTAMITARICCASTTRGTTTRIRRRPTAREQPDTAVQGAITGRSHISLADRGAAEDCDAVVVSVGGTSLVRIPLTWRGGLGDSQAEVSVGLGTHERLRRRPQPLRAPPSTRWVGSTTPRRPSSPKSMQPHSCSCRSQYRRNRLNSVDRRRSRSVQLSWPQRRFRTFALTEPAMT